MVLRVDMGLVLGMLLGAVLVMALRNGLGDEPGVSECSSE